MRTLAIVPVKSFDLAKQRLAGALEPEVRHRLARAMFADVLVALQAARALEGVIVVTGDLEAGTIARRTTTVVHDAEEAGQSAAATLGVGHALDRGAERVVLLPGDTPLIDPAELDALLARTAAVGIVSDRHGTGTNALVLSPPDAIGPSFGPGSLARHVAAARAAGVRHRVERVPSIEHDVDTPDDLATLIAALDAAAGRASVTRDAVARLGLAAAARG